MSSQFSRRELLASLAAAGVLGGLYPGVARAEISGGKRKFLFIYTLGGWDFTRVFSPELLASPYVSTEADASDRTLGGITFVDHPERPSVPEFFEAAAGEVSVINGVFVPTVSHGIGRRLMISADPSSENPDWATRIAAATADEFLAPHLCIAGPASAGGLGANLVRTGANHQLSRLVTGEILDFSEISTGRLSEANNAAVEAYLEHLAEQRAMGDGQTGVAANDYLLSLQKGSALRELGDEIDLRSGNTFDEQLGGALEALSRGLSRSVSTCYPVANDWTAWDSHSMNDARQTPLFEGLFAALIDLRETLQTTPGAVSQTLADETVVVVLSEMGRTPALNDALGKDHWHYTSAMLWGPGVQGGLTVGAYDELSQGTPIDYHTGLPSDDGRAIALDSLGATLLSLAGIDPTDQGVTAEVMHALLESS